MKISKMYSYDGWICSKQEPGRKYLERIREVTVNEMLGIDKNLLQRDDYGNLIYKNPLGKVFVIIFSREKEKEDGGRRS